MMLALKTAALGMAAVFVVPLLLMAIIYALGAGSGKTAEKSTETDAPDGVTAAILAAIREDGGEAAQVVSIKEEQ